MCNRWRIKAKGAADDAYLAKSGYSLSSVADEFTHKGFYFQTAKKADRITEWQFMRRMLADVGKVDTPGLYISRGCTYFWDTLPYLARDLKRGEVLDSSGQDHVADACHYVQV